MASRVDRSEPLEVAVIPSSFSGFSLTAPTAEVALDEIGELRDAGATALVISLPSSGWDDQLLWVAEEVKAKI